MDNENVTATSLHVGEDLGINPHLFIYYVTHTITYKSGILLGRFMLPCICVIGLVGNTLALMVVTRNMKISCYIYMAALAVTDSIALCMAIIGWYFAFIHNEVLSYSNRMIMCRALVFVLAATIMCSTYIIVSMTLDRLVAVQWPLKALHWCTTKKAKLTIMTIVMLCPMFKMPYIWYSGSLASSNVCSSFRGEQTTLLVAYYWINTVVANYIPFCSLLIMNGLIIHSIKRRRSNFNKTSRSGAASSSGTSERTAVRSITNADGSNGASISNQNIGKRRLGSTKKTKPVSDGNVITMLLLISFSFLICSAPMYVNYIVYMMVDRFASPKAYGLFVLLNNLTLLLINTSCANNFYLYCMSGTKFRHDLKQVLIKLFHLSTD